MDLVTHYNYWIVVALMMVGLYVVFASGNMVKRLVGLSVFQTSVFLFYISVGKVAGGVPPILPEDEAHGGGHHGDTHAATAGHAGASGDHDAGDAHAADAEGHDAEALEHAADDHGAEAADHAAGAVDHGAEAGDHAVDAAAHASDIIYSNPLPHVLILTAIVVGVATLAVGLALVVRIRDAYGSIEDDEINRAEYDADVRGADA